MKPHARREFPRFRRRSNRTVIKIRVQVPGEEARIATVDGAEALIGRDPNCDIQIPVPHVSGLHVRLVAGIVVCDQRSTNGVWINDRETARPTLLKGTTIRLGSEPDMSPELEVLEMSLGDVGHVLRAVDEDVIPGGVLWRARSGDLLIPGIRPAEDRIHIHDYPAVFETGVPNDLARTEVGFRV